MSMMKKNSTKDQEMAQIVDRNINALLHRKHREENEKTKEEKIADSITRFTGSMLFVYIHLAIFGIWILWNSGLFDVPMFDKSYVILAMFASVEAIFLSTFVLISQNRMNLQADKRAELDLQITLLAEHEITRLVTMMTSIAKKMDVDVPLDAEELEKDIHPEEVMDRMEKFTKQKKNGK
jgi:uncharacterized membrane protein